MTSRRARRALQVGYVLLALATVAVGDATANALGQLWGTEPAMILRLAARVLGGWAVGTALRLELGPRARPDRGLRRLLALPLALVAGWPLLLTFLPGPALAALPLAVTGSVAQGLAPFAGAALGVVLALALSRRRS